MRRHDEAGACVEVITHGRMVRRHPGPASREVVHQRQTVSFGLGGLEIKRRGGREVEELGCGEKITDEHDATAVPGVPPAVEVDHAANRIRLLCDQFHDQRGVCTVADGRQEAGDQVGPVFASVVGIEDAGVDDAGLSHLNRLVFQ